MTTATLPATETRVRTAAAAPRRRRRFDALTLGLGVWTVVVYVFMFLPILFVVVHSFTDSRDFTRWGGFTTDWYRRFLDNPGLRASLMNSLKVAVVATVISVVLGGLAGIALARRPGVWTKAFLALVFLILVTPEIVDAIGLQIWFVELGGIFREGLVPLWFGQSIFSSAVVTLIVRARMAGPRRVAGGGGGRPLRPAGPSLPPDHAAAGVPGPARRRACWRSRSASTT